MNTVFYKDNKVRNTSLLAALILAAIVLSLRLCYVFLSDAKRFPITTIKISASYQHISHKQLEIILSDYAAESFFSLSVVKLQRSLAALAWVDTAAVERVWPDTLKISLIEKIPVAIFRDSLLSNKGELFSQGATNNDLHLPELYGPVEQMKDVLQVYQKLSKILSGYGLSAEKLRLRDNQAWELGIENGVTIYLGKQDIELRVLRFCKAYPALFADKTEHLASVDLRYPRGMAVQWKQ